MIALGLIILLFSKHMVSWLPVGYYNSLLRDLLWSVGREAGRRPDCGVLLSPGALPHLCGRVLYTWT